MVRRSGRGAAGDGEGRIARVRTRGSLGALRGPPSSPSPCFFAVLSAAGFVQPAWAGATVVISTPAGGDVLRGTTVDITGTASGDVDLVAVDVSVDGGATWSPAIVESGAGTTDLVWRYSWALPAEDNSTDHAVAARVWNGENAIESSVVGPTVRVDTLAPAVTTFLVNGDAPFTGSTEVTLTIDAVDGTLPMEMQFSNDGVAWSNWWPSGVATTWSLSPGDGLKVVRARFRDGLGNITTGAISDAISLSTAGPTITARSPASGAVGVSTVTYVQTAFSSPMDPPASPRRRCSYGRTSTEAASMWREGSTCRYRAR